MDLPNTCLLKSERIKRLVFMADVFFMKNQILKQTLKLNILSENVEIVP